MDSLPLFVKLLKNVEPLLNNKIVFSNDSSYSLVEVAGFLLLSYVAYKLFAFTVDTLGFWLQLPPPKVVVNIEPDESTPTLVNKTKFDPKKLIGETKVVHLWDPSTLDYFGSRPAMTEKEVEEILLKAKVAQNVWKKSSFSKRRLLMRTMQRYFTENQEVIARVSVRDSGKTVLDAIVGEILVTCEKLAWLVSEGEQHLQRESRSTGRMMIMKKVWVEFTPVGVVGAIVPWNYPFHNLFNPISAALFSGNAIVIKVSEYASWSIDYYKRIMDGCLDAIGAPRDLVQIVVGYGATGAALVKSKNVDKLIFVGSPGVGAIVARDASANLTPVVLELGGKDPFIVCDDVDVSSIVQTACRGVWQNMGQNCAGPERFFVYEKVYQQFCDGVTSVVTKMKQGPSNNDPFVDCGAICMGYKQMEHYQKLVDDVVAKGGKILAGGFIPDKKNELSKGCFYPATILADVPENALIAQEEIFGPIMCIFKVRNNSDEECIRMANNCDFALSSCAFSGSYKRAHSIASRLDAGMSAVNDLEGCTYLSQSLPFGGCKKSGYDRFAGPEGLRGLCNIRSVCVDLIPFLRNSIPPPMHYPSTGVGHHFSSGLVKFFYGTSFVENFKGIFTLIKYSIIKPKKQ